MSVLMFLTMINVQDAIGTASDCYDCICWVMESVGLGCPSV